MYQFLTTQTKEKHLSKDIQKYKKKIRLFFRLSLLMLFSSLYYLLEFSIVEN